VFVEHRGPVVTARWLWGWSLTPDHYRPEWRERDGEPLAEVIPLYVRPPDDVTYAFLVRLMHEHQAALSTS
jgi:hypothetical protein